MTTHPLVEYFRCPEQFAVLATSSCLSADAGYFRFDDAICYGRQAIGAPASRADGRLVDVSRGVWSASGKTFLPFDLSEVLDNLRYERYSQTRRAAERISTSSVPRAVYYFFRPVLPVGVRRHLQRLSWMGWKNIAFPRWPVDVTVEMLMRRMMGLVLARGTRREVPFIWFWPDAAPGCAMMTHDVDGAAGASFCRELTDLDDQFGVRSAFQVVPDAPWARNGETGHLVEQLRRRGFEVNVHDLSHDGRLFRDRGVFLRRVAHVNARGRQFGSRGFRSGAMYRRQDWFAALDFAYDMSVPNVAHLEPQRGGCCTVMPFFLGHLLELPLTTAQDYTVFHVLGDYSTRLWREQIDQILEQNGLVSFIAHPDYLREPRARATYGELLRILARLRDEHNVWIAPPSEIEQWWRMRREMTLVPDGESWGIEGPGSDRACVAWARLADTRLVYEVGRSRRAA